MALNRQVRSTLAEIFSATLIFVLSSFSPSPGILSRLKEIRRKDIAPWHRRRLDAAIGIAVYHRYQVHSNDGGTKQDVVCFPSLFHPI